MEKLYISLIILVAVAISWLVFFHDSDCQYGWWNTDVKLRHDILFNVADALENPRVKDKITRCFGEKEKFEAICKEWGVTPYTDSTYRLLQNKIKALDNDCCSLSITNGIIEMEQRLNVFTFESCDGGWRLVNVHLFADKCGMQLHKSKQHRLPAQI